MTAQTQSLTGIDLLAEIARLKKERNAVILAHYYQKPEIQDLADFVGDSLDLSRKAAATDADVIAFCGVRFMAETAKILSPEKTVILPDMDAGCSLEDSCPPDQFKAFRDAHPDHIALTYINCSTEVKALSDIIVTSSSAETILAQIPADQKIIFGPDKNLGGYLKRKTGRAIVDHIIETLPAADGTFIVPLLKDYIKTLSIGSFLNTYVCESFIKVGSAPAIDLSRTDARSRRCK